MACHVRYVDHTYRDYSTYVQEGGELVKHKKSGNNFPARLHEVVSKEANSHAIAWMPHGRAFKIVDKGKLISDVLPQYLLCKKYESFSRQLNGWGFKRLHQSGPDFGCYYHECFLRQLPELTCLIRRLPPNLGKTTPFPDGEPNFYMISRQFPVPPDTNASLGRPARSNVAALPPAPLHPTDDSTSPKIAATAASMQYGSSSLYPPSSSYPPSASYPQSSSYPPSAIYNSQSSSYRYYNDPPYFGNAVPPQDHHYQQYPAHMYSNFSQPPQMGHSYNQHQHAAHAYQGQGGGWGGGLSFPPPPPPIAHADDSAVPSQSNAEEEEDSKPAAAQNNDEPSPRARKVDPFMPIPLSRSASKQERVEPQTQATDNKIPDQNQNVE